jgi:hypothetical protein
MTIITFAIGAVAGAVATVSSQAVYKFVTKQKNSVVNDVKAEAAKVEVAVEKKV